MIDRRRLLRLSFVILLIVMWPSRGNGQVRLSWSDGSAYLTGSSSMQVYYLYTAGGGNGTFDHPATCQNYGTFITIVNSTGRTLDFYANVQVGAVGDPCGNPLNIPIRGSVGPHGSLKLRATPDVWVSPQTRLGVPGIQFTDARYR